MTNLTSTEREELEQLRKSAAKFMTDPLEKVFFELQSLLDRPASERIDSIMPHSAFRVLARAVILLKDRVIK
jgi:hypothetical protein